MNRRRFLKSTGLTLAALAFLDAVSEAKALGLLDDDFKIKMLNENTGIFIAQGGTILFQLGKSGPVIVDDQFPPYAKMLIKELSKKTSLPYQLLINTHHHADHTAGNIAFKDIVPHILAHQNSKLNQENSSIAKGNQNEQLLPDRTYEKVWCEKIGNEKICLKYFGPAHTNGDSVVFFQSSNIVHVGDLVFNKMHPFIDKPYGASIKNWQLVLDNILKSTNKKTKIICGHAAEGSDVIITREEVRNFKNYLSTLYNFVENEVTQHKTREEIIANKVLPGFENWNNKFIENCLDSAYTEVTENYK
ncbi:MAG: MBL fold metallo-hydrolase [Bacteroidetes bacterium]|nr:MBL fold metallo-hydrolase [Bacteroidota bacterium]